MPTSFFLVLLLLLLIFDYFSGFVVFLIFLADNSYATREFANNSEFFEFPLTKAAQCNLEENLLFFPLKLLSRFNATRFLLKLCQNIINNLP